MRVPIATLVFGLSFGLAGGTAATKDISGIITTTLTISEDSQLVGNVTCRVNGAPCIAVVSSGVSLRLNGFTITGQADPVTGCAGAGTAGENGILIDGVRGVIIQGPGIVERFRNQGIIVNASSRVLVSQVTASTNCASGIWVGGNSTDNEIEANISVRNGNGAAACGGIWLAGGASRNRLRANRLIGNGYATQGNNFGIGLPGAGANDNVIVGNTAVGNANGIFVGSLAAGNVIRGNIVVGNPAVQVSVNNPTTTGVDIRNLAASGVNTIIDNVCLTALNAACPSVENTPQPPR